MSRATLQAAFSELADAQGRIAQKNIKQIPNWTHKNPGYADPKSNKNTDYLNIVKESVSEFEEENNQKIIKLISKETVIEK